MVVTGVLATNRTRRLQDRKTGQSGVPNPTIRFPRRQQQPLVSSQIGEWVPEGVSSVDGPGGNQDQTGSRSETSTDDEVKRDTEKGPEEVAAQQNKAQGEETEIRVDVMASF
jgi:hypothetical protein